MANPIRFTPAPIDPKLELQKRVDAAPVEHAEALLVAWDVLQSAHDKGLLDALQGMIDAKDTIAGKVAEYAKLPEGIAGIRNLLTAAKILTELDPEVLEKLSRAIRDASEEQRKETTPPSLWQIAKRAMSEDGRRGLSFATLLLTGFGRGMKR
ncbi:MAG: hypothetical protein JWM43_1676 [Acidobacteriaceae bacterium]|nr:hypothetical protein [Acidobacteriaceae bacterium]